MSKRMFWKLFQIINGYNHRTTPFIREFIFFGFVAFFVSLVVVGLLFPYTRYGFSPDDWQYVFNFDIFPGNIFDKFIGVWRLRGSYDSIQTVYVGVLVKIFGLNYQVFRIVNIVLRILSILSIYILTLVLFGRRLFAFLTTLLLSFNASAVGYFELVGKGTESIAIIFMSFFAISYYKIIKAKKVEFHSVFLLMLFFTLSVFFNTPRLFPLVMIPPIVQAIMIIKERNIKALKFSLKVIVLLYLPFLLVFILRPAAILVHLNGPSVIYEKVVNGNWHLLVTPFSGLGYTFAVEDYLLKIFGVVEAQTLESYVVYLLKGPLLIFGIFTIVISYLAKVRRPFFFTTLILISNFFLYLFLFWLIENNKSTSIESRVPFVYIYLHSYFLGIFILILSITLFFKWFSKRTNNYLLISLWVGPIFSFIFIVGNWIFANYLLGFNPTHPYLAIPTIGSSLFTSAILIMIYDSLKGSRQALTRLVSPLVFLAIIPLGIIGVEKIYGYSKHLMDQGKAIDQDRTQGQIKQAVQPCCKEPILVYFDSKDDNKNTSFYEASVFNSFYHWMLYQDGLMRDGCVGEIINDKTTLKSSLAKTDGEYFINYRGYCFERENGEFGFRNVTYELDNFYAFRLEGKNVVDIREQVFEGLEIEAR